MIIKKPSQLQKDIDAIKPRGIFKFYQKLEDGSVAYCHYVWRYTKYSWVDNKLNIYSNYYYDNVMYSDNVMYNYYGERQQDLDSKYYDTVEKMHEIEDYDVRKY